MSEAKLLIIAQALKSDHPFRIMHIEQTTGLSKQLVRHHLKLLERAGWLERNGNYYSVAERDELLNEMVAAGLNRRDSHALTPTVLIGENEVTAVNDLAKTYFALKALDFPHANLIKRKLLRLIDESLETLERGRRYVNTSSMRPMPARKFIENQSTLWEDIRGIVGEELTTEDFNEWLEGLS